MMDFDMIISFLQMLGLEVICYVEKQDVKDYFEDATQARAQWPHSFLPGGLSKWGFVTDASIKLIVESVQEVVEDMNMDNDRIVESSNSPKTNSQSRAIDLDYSEGQDGDGNVQINLEIAGQDLQEKMAGRTKTSHKVRARKEKKKQAKDTVISGRQKREGTSTFGEQRKKQKNRMPEEQEASKRSDKEPTTVTKTQEKVLHITESKIVIELDSDDDDGVVDTRFDWSRELEPIESLQRVKVEANNADMMDVKPTIVTSDVLVRFMEQQAEENRKRDEEYRKRDEENRRRDEQFQQFLSMMMKSGQMNTSLGAQGTGSGIAIEAEIQTAPSSSTTNAHPGVMTQLQHIPGLTTMPNDVSKLSISN
jgi:hypothetical protein